MHRSLFAQEPSAPFAFTPLQVCEMGLIHTQLAVDLGELRKISRVEILWESAFAKKYTIEVSVDGTDWKQVYATAQGSGGRESVRFSPVSVRWVRLAGTERNMAQGGYSIREFRVMEE